MKRGLGKAILKLVRESKQPLSTREIAHQLDVAWHTADRHCLKLQLDKKIDCFTIGKATAWYKR